MSPVLRRFLPKIVPLALVIAAAIYAKGAIDDPAPPPRGGRIAQTQPQPKAPAGASALSSLPAEARQTVALIRSDGPFPYERDGAVFRNAEGRLPGRPRGYYHEYTVPTPGESDRGARRIIAGGDGELFYTADHYESFVRIDPGR